MNSLLFVDFSSGEMFFFCLFAVSNFESRLIPFLYFVPVVSALGHKPTLCGSIELEIRVRHDIDEDDDEDNGANRCAFYARHIRFERHRRRYQNKMNIIFSVRIQ